jgi:cellulose synthase/poly-beta-1,6-N-acetylglucosamine synthase-like glycosyltransferase
LLEEKYITGSQLEEVLLDQLENGGRLGDICIAKGFITNDQLIDVLNRSNRQKGRLGETLIEEGYITEEQLKKAIEMQNRSGGKLGEILLFLGYVDQSGLFKNLANNDDMGRIGQNVNLDKLPHLPYNLANKHSAIVIGDRKNSYIVAVQEKLDDEAQREIEEYLKKPIEQVLASIEEITSLWEQIYRNNQKYKSVFDLYDEQPENSAIVTFTSMQLAAILIIIITIIIGVLTNWRVTLFGINILFQIIYAIMTILKLIIVLKGESKNTQIKYSSKVIKCINERDLPVYTLLIPVFKETEVIKSLIKNIEAFDYPQYKLDVRILLEEDDIDTIKVVSEMKLPSFYTVIIVPKSTPQTKPKACNYGLLRAKGEYVVIYDAEDRPESDQLKKAYLAFKDLPDEYVCVQAKLNYFNSKQNFLTKLFTQEYSMWFELLLVGIMQMDVPVPLGGTSNHFKSSFLKEVGGWDPFNVTEDADLGIRLFKFNYKTAILDSHTWEEANSNVFNWIRQRSRWIKGYMQTWLVHMRHPVSLYKTLGLRGFIGYQAMILGTPLLPLINPFFWALLVIWYATGAGWIKDLFPGIFYYLACFQLVFGNFMFTYVNIMGMYRVTRGCAIRNEKIFSYGLIKYALMTPIYWLLMSIASYKAFFQLISKPFYWEKTEHGLVEEEEYETI